MAERSILRAAIAGMAYFAMVFAAGFALGALRVLIIGPRLGEALAVSLEIPVMLALSWIACSWLVARIDVRGKAADRMVMGGVALAILMVAEFGLSALAFGRSIVDHLSHYRELPALLGLAGQLAFAALPLIQSAKVHRKEP
jgi:hypothetical protein